MPWNPRRVYLKDELLRVAQELRRLGDAFDDAQSRGLADQVEQAAINNRIDQPSQLMVTLSDAAAYRGLSSLSSARALLTKSEVLPATFGLKPMYIADEVLRAWQTVPTRKKLKDS